MLIPALLLGLVEFFGEASDGYLGEGMFNRPILVGSLAGLVLGDLEQGMIIAASIELAWMGIMYIGVSVPADVTVGSIVGTAVAIIGGGGVEVALAVAVPVGLLSSYLNTACRIAITMCMPRIDKYAANGEIDKINRFHIISGLLICVFKSSLVVLTILIGADYIEGIVNAIPKELMTGMSVVSSLLPALGFGMLMNIMWDKRYISFYFIGFICSVYLKMDVIAVAGVAIAIAAMKYFSDDGKAVL